VEDLPVASNALPTILQNGSLIASYKQVLDLLSSAYWEASDMPSKDLIYGVEQSIGEIITALDTEQVASLTEQFVALKPKIDATNVALGKIKADVDKITKNIGTASMLVAGITKVLGMIPL
jgi:hypothetical protein